MDSFIYSTSYLASFWTSSYNPTLTPRTSAAARHNNIMADSIDESGNSSPLSSDLSSIASRSPSPNNYPSPISSQDHDTPDALSGSDTRKRKTDEEGPTVAKKRKPPIPKPRTTETLDLTQDPLTFSVEQKQELDMLMKVLRKRRKIVVIAGAGISVSAGIPDFRSSTGLFKTLKSEHKLKASGKQLFDASVYQTDSSTGAFHEMVRNLSGLVSKAEPTAFHQMLSTLGNEGRLMRLYTQNVDGIDVALPSLETTVPLSQKGPWPRTVQLHGGLEKMVCSKCRSLSDFDAELFDGPEPPPCPKCIEADRVRTDHAGKRSHGIGRLRPRIVLYNEHNPDEEAIGGVMSADLRSRPDALIVVGTSMKIPGVRRIVKEMCGVVRGRRDGLTVWINRDPPPTGIQFEDCWDLIVKGASDEVARQWDLSINPHEECTRSEVDRAMTSSKFEVQVEKPEVEGMITPAPSPLPGASKKPVIKLIVQKPGTKAIVKAGKDGQTQKPKAGDKTKNKPGTKRLKKTNDAAKLPKINKTFKSGKPNTEVPAGASKVKEPRSPTISQLAPVSPSALNMNGTAASSIFPVTKNVHTKQESSDQLQYWAGDKSSPLSILSDASVEALVRNEMTPSKPGRKSDFPQQMDLSNISIPHRGSTQSSPVQGTISPGSKPRGMETLID